MMYVYIQYIRGSLGIKNYPYYRLQQCLTGWDVVLEYIKKEDKRDEENFSNCIVYFNGIINVHR